MMSFILTTLCITLLLLWKNTLTHSLRLKEIDLCYELREPSTPLGLLIEFEDGPSYDEILFNPFVWTHEQAYGDQARIKRGLKPRG